MKRKLLFIAFFYVFFRLWCFAVAQPIIAIIKSRDIASDNTALEGFKEALKEGRILAELKEYDLKEKNVIEKIKSQKPDLILSLGTYATKEISEKIKNIPIVFCMVMDTEGSGLKAKNITGASLDIPIKTYLGKMKAVLPKTKTVGVIYNPEENENTISKAIKISQDTGLILKSYPVNSIKEIPKVEEMEIDALWLIPDTSICQPGIIKHILYSSLKSKIPVIGISPSYVKAGALLALSCDYEDTGRQSGEIAVMILKGESPSDIPVGVPRKTRMYLNLAVADRLGLSIPEDIIISAEEVFGR